jgi:uncharacterized protein YjbJ (UPF0337 family)
MNVDQLKGKSMQFKGELKQQHGKFTDDDLQRIGGNYEKFIGKVQERYGEKKDELMKWADQWQQRSQPEPRRKRRAATVPGKSVNVEIRKENSGRSGGYVTRLAVQYI